VILHGEPLEAPSLDAVLEGDVKVFHFPPRRISKLAPPVS
jgi:hypothetical protein